MQEEISLGDGALFFDNRSTTRALTSVQRLLLQLHAEEDGGSGSGGGAGATTGSGGSRSAAGGAGGGRCVVCLQHEPTTAFVPCGHMISCSNCAPRLQECPACREPVVKRQRVYL